MCKAPEMGTEGEQASKKLFFCSGAELGQAKISRKSAEIGAESGYCKMVSLPHLENLELEGLERGGHFSNYDPDHCNKD